MKSLGCRLLEASRIHQGKYHSVPFLLSLNIFCLSLPQTSYWAGWIRWLHLSCLKTTTKTQARPDQASSLRPAGMIWPMSIPLTHLKRMALFRQSVGNDSWPIQSPDVCPGFVWEVSSWHRDLANSLIVSMTILRQELACYLLCCYRGSQRATIN